MSATPLVSFRDRVGQEGWDSSDWSPYLLRGL